MKSSCRSVNATLIRLHYIYGYIYVDLFQVTDSVIETRRNGADGDGRIFGAKRMGKDRTIKVT